ncbi:MAG TPA: pyruvate kinase [Candidatus Paceibacterota bacterium]|jgi:pyruvate kinase|nr:pyruvate kinase [Candidatus Paceibacterota bacterium]
MTNDTSKTRSRAQIVATLGPATNTYEKIKALAQSGADVFRLNFSWGDFDEHRAQIQHVRQAEKDLGISLVILQDVPGPRIQKIAGHSYNHDSVKALTDHDRECIMFGITEGVDYVALSFVGTAEDVQECRQFINEKGGKQPIIAKIERAIAVQNLDQIVMSADGLMVARGDLGEEVPLEQIPFVQADIISRANSAGKPVITATQMMLSMVDHAVPTRAEVTDVEAAVMQGSDAVMLSEETAKGSHPLEAVVMMEKILVEAEKHVHIDREFNLLKRL